ncbi:MAG TPA: hypothetical protein VN688_12465 [Gemmataceae bacterium]|nr:hypothetical protein [Gemmataceae bacterium]
MSGMEKLCALLAADEAPAEGGIVRGGGRILFVLSETEKAAADFRRSVGYASTPASRKFQRLWKEAEERKASHRRACRARVTEGRATSKPSRAVGLKESAGQCVFDKSGMCCCRRCVSH